MSIKLYMDVHVRRAVYDGLRLRGIDVLTAREDGAAEFEDDKLLDRATDLNPFCFRKTTIFCAKPINVNKRAKHSQA